jgi:hypothetical protein
VEKTPMIESRHVRLIDLFADLEVDRVVGDPAA